MAVVLGALLGGYLNVGVEGVASVASGSHHEAHMQVFREPQMDASSCEERADGEGAVVHLAVEAGIVSYDGIVSFETRTFDGNVPGRTICVRPGERLTVHLHNRLGAELNEGAMHDWNEERYPNITSLHAHGLHVSPDGHGDNVLVGVAPGESREYIYDVPIMHPTGTYWLHAHFHGSSAYQTAYSMATALLVRAQDKRRVSEESEDRVVLVQNVLVGTSSGRDDYRLSRESGSGLALRVAAAVDVPINIITVNGLASPVAHRTHSSAWIRWRIINAAIDGYLVLNMIGHGRECRALRVAADGKDIREPKMLEAYLVPPGGRVDVAVRCHRSYALTTGYEYIESASLLRDVKEHLGPGTNVHTGHLLRVAPREHHAHSKNHPYSHRSSKDEADDLRLVDDGEVLKRTIEWTVDSSNRSRGKLYGMNGVQFDNSSAFSIEIGRVYEWRIVNRRVVKPGGTFAPADESHPFHMHTNKFQIVGAGRYDASSSPQRHNISALPFAYAAGEWRDTVSVPSPGGWTCGSAPSTFRERALRTATFSSTRTRE